MFHSFIYLYLTLIVVSVSVVYATSEYFGINDWTCSDVSQFLKLSVVDISEELLLQHKVDGD